MKIVINSKLRKEIDEAKIVTIDKDKKRVVDVCHKIKVLVS